jgi:hypothetical protein
MGKVWEKFGRGLEKKQKLINPKAALPFLHYNHEHNRIYYPDTAVVYHFFKIRTIQSQNIT